MRRPEPLLPALLALLAGTGCVEHRAAIQPPVAGPPPAVVTVHGREEALVESLERRDPLPLELRASAIRRDADGRLLRDEIAVLTPLPWWQRFPADVVSDALIPHTFIVDARARIDTRVVADMPADDLLRLAREHGYAQGITPPGEE